MCNACNMVCCASDQSSGCGCDCWDPDCEEACDHNIPVSDYCQRCDEERVEERESDDYQDDAR